MWNLFQRSYKRENFLHFVFVCPVVLKKNKNKNLTASQRSRWRFVILSLPSSLSCRVYDSALFWSWGSDRGPDTIYLMLVTHTQWDGLSGKTFILFQCLPSGAPGPLSFSCVFKKNMGIYFPSLFWARGIHCFEPHSYTPLCIIM